jgi:hypothetical protein
MATTLAPQCGEQSPVNEEIASGKEQERPRNDTMKNHWRMICYKMM